MDSPLPPDFDPYSLSEPADAGGDEGDDGYESSNQDRQAKSAQVRPQRPGSNRAHKDSDFPHENSMFKDVFEFLIPPRDDTPENIRRWRITIGIASAILYLHVLIACGVFQYLGFSGFAYASDVSTIKSEILEEKIFDARLRQCTATTQESRLFYAEKVQELLARVNWSKGQYRLPSCDEIR